MESRPERSSMDEAQKTKLIFISLAAVVTILLIISFVYGNRARNERDAARKDLELLKQDNVKLSRWLEDKTQESEQCKKALEECKAKPKPAPAKKAPAKKTTTSKKSSKKKTN
jgi:regulatory protein YycI of two-component signal transduction system YycFG